MTIYFAQVRICLLIVLQIRYIAFGLNENGINASYLRVKTTTPASDCGLRPYHTENNPLLRNRRRRVKRIVGGSSALEGEWPWQVMVKEKKFFGTFTDYKCGGTLISKNFVLTAAHCQPKPIMSHLVVVLGQYSLNQTDLPTISVNRVIVHKKFNQSNFHNDIALLELATPADISAKVYPICLPGAKDHFVGYDGVVSGWGRLYYNGELPRTLQCVTVPILSQRQCSSMLRKHGHIKELPNFFLCAGHEGGRFDACEGDSGGPLAVYLKSGQWVLAGTVSHGVRCAEPGLPGVYMKVSHYRPWIDAVIQRIESAAKSPQPQSWFYPFLDWLDRTVPIKISTPVIYY